MSPFDDISRELSAFDATTLRGWHSSRRVTLAKSLVSATLPSS